MASVIGTIARGLPQVFERGMARHQEGQRREREGVIQGRQDVQYEQQQNAYEQQQDAYRQLQERMRSDKDFVKNTIDQISLRVQEDPEYASATKSVDNFITPTSSKKEAADYLMQVQGELRKQKAKKSMSGIAKSSKTMGDFTREAAPYAEEPGFGVIQRGLPSESQPRTSRPPASQDLTNYLKSERNTAENNARMNKKDNPEKARKFEAEAEYFKKLLDPSREPIARSREHAGELIEAFRRKGRADATKILQAIEIDEKFTKKETGQLPFKDDNDRRTYLEGRIKRIPGVDSLEEYYDLIGKEYPSWVTDAPEEEKNVLETIGGAFKSVFSKEQPKLGQFNNDQRTQIMNQVSTDHPEWTEDKKKAYVEWKMNNQR